ncbi:ribonuclease H-like domain-containing protein, partial [Rhizoctonia solani]
FMAQLEEYMAARGMDFDRHGNRLRCFPHVINLAVQDILAALADSAADFQRAEASKGSTLTDEVIAYLIALSTSPHNRVQRTAAALRLGQRRQGLQNIIDKGNRNGLFRQPKHMDGLWIMEEFIMRPLQLILDCPTRWSSTYYMIDRFLYLYPAVTRYIASVPALAEHTITHRDFEVLYDIRTVLGLAHRVQELLSSDKTPTLSYALPLYHALIDQWRQLQHTLPALSYAIGAGIKKIEDYIARVWLSPAYIIVMALNPSIGYQWIDKNLPAESERAQDTMKAHVSFLLKLNYFVLTL